MVLSAELFNSSQSLYKITDRDNNGVSMGDLIQYNEGNKPVCKVEQAWNHCVKFRSLYQAICLFSSSELPEIQSSFSVHSDYDDDYVFLRLPGEVSGCGADDKIGSGESYEMDFMMLDSGWLMVGVEENLSEFCLLSPDGVVLKGYRDLNSGKTRFAFVETLEKMPVIESTYHNEKAFQYLSQISAVGVAECIDVEDLDQNQKDILAKFFDLALKRLESIEDVVTGDETLVGSL